MQEEGVVLPIHHLDHPPRRGLILHQDHPPQDLTHLLDRLTLAGAVALQANLKGLSHLLDRLTLAGAVALQANLKGLSHLSQKQKRN